MPPPDRQAREILEVTRNNPHLSPKEIAARVGCPRTEVTDVLQRYEDANAVDRALDAAEMTTGKSSWVFAVVLGAIGLAGIGLGSGAGATIPVLLLGIGMLGIGIAALSWF